MPRKAKETVEINNDIELERVVKSKSTKSRTKKGASEVESKGIKTKDVSKASKTAGVAKKATAKSTGKKTATQKTKSATSKKTTSKRTTTRKKATGASTTRRKATSKLQVATPAKVLATEYYDLPYRYNETIVKVLAQTPKSLFVYWDISDTDRANLVKTFGENFFNDTIPFLRITNESTGYSFEVDIDDFANGWYVSIPDAKSSYSVSLLRKQRPFRDKIVEHEVYVTTSNKIEAPNDHILFEKATPTVLYKNVKNNTVTSKKLPAAIYRKSRQAIYGLYKYYKEIYQNENIDEVFNLENPSSSNPTSTFK